MSTKNTFALQLSTIQNESLAVLSKIIGSTAQHVALLDVPRHRNLGDALIWQGEVNYMKRLGLQLVYTADHSQYSQRVMDALPGDTVILLHGGGNFGDLYPQHHSFRELVIQSNPNRKIVLLPQSFFFEEEGNLDHTKDIYQRHPDLSLLAREQRTLEAMRTHFAGARVEFCHDMAFGLELSPSRKRCDRVDYVVRQDKESLRDSNAIGKPDWTNGGTINNTVWHAARVTAGLTRRVLGSSSTVSQRVFRDTNEIIRKLNVKAAVEGFSRSSSVVTDRLHAHVLATLLQIPNYFTDNNYGKIRSVFQATSSRLGIGHPVQTLQEAEALAVTHVE